VLVFRFRGAVHACQKPATSVDRAKRTVEGTPPSGRSTQAIPVAVPLPWITGLIELALLPLSIWISVVGPGTKQPSSTRPSQLLSSPSQ
jgi:hypothetical protein